MSKLPVGTKVKFVSEKRPYTVQASDERYAICTKPFNIYRTVLYTIIDFKEQIRGPENLVFGFGAETREQCEEMLARLTAPCDHEGEGILCDCRSQVTHRNRISLDIEATFPPAKKETTQ